MIIWKYPLLIKPGQTAKIELPIGSKIIHFGFQNDSPTLWVLVGAVRTIMVKHTFAVVGTGWELPDDAKYIGTFTVGEFVWHVIERKHLALAA